MSISSEISRISGNVADAFDAIEDKGVTVPSGSTSDDLADLIAQIPTGSTEVVSIVDTTDTAGGTIRTITAVDISDSTVTASDVLNSKWFYTAQGVKTQGTATGGGGGGLVYETGTYIPSSDIAQPTISFANTHTTRPYSVIIADASGEIQSENYCYMWAIENWYDFLGEGFLIGTNQFLYARTSYVYKTSSNYASGTNNISYLTGTATTCMPYYLTETGFTPYLGTTTSRFFKSGRTYKWIAVWAPTT